MFKTKTVDKVIDRFTKAIKDLRAVVEAKEREVDKVDDQIDNLLEKEKNLLDEYDRANRMIAKLQKLFSLKDELSEED
jgi:peptidoglycan hydrolase CwlO-like protein